MRIFYACAVAGIAGSCIYSRIAAALAARHALPGTDRRSGILHAVAGLVRRQRQPGPYGRNDARELQHYCDGHVGHRELLHHVPTRRAVERSQPEYRRHFPQVVKAKAFDREVRKERTQRTQSKILTASSPRSPRLPLRSLRLKASRCLAPYTPHLEPSLICVQPHFAGGTYSFGLAEPSPKKN